MDNKALTYDVIMKRFRDWALQRSDIRFAMILGSRARIDFPADEWSDLDVAFVTTNAGEYIASADWLQNMGTCHLTFVEPTAVGDMKERRALFDGGLDVDFIPVPSGIIQNGWPQEVMGVLSRGYKVILDKDNLESSMPRVSQVSNHFAPPTQPEFQQLVHDFLYHTVWVAKKLCRGELWTAKLCCDSHMKWQLLHMMEWHSQTVLQHQDTWHNGRFLSQWADSRALEHLKSAFAKYDAVEVWRALFETKELFRWLAAETADHLGLAYPADADTYVTSLLESFQSRCSQ